MGKPILYGYDISPPVRAVLLTANAIGLDFEYREVNIMAGAHLSEDYLKKNPQHTIPMLEDDGKCIWDSHAIAVYLIEKYGDDKFLYPKDLYKRAIIDQRLHFDSGVLFPTFRRIVDSLRTKGTIEEEDGKRLLDAFEFLEKFLSKDLYLGGNCLTVADLCCVATVSSLTMNTPVDVVKFPKLNEWLQRMALLPYYQKANGEGLARAVELFKNMASSAQRSQ